MDVGEDTVHEIERLRERLREAEETIEAIRSGDVDAVVVAGPHGIPQVYALETADQTYRVLVEEMQEGALTLSTDGAVLYCNRRLAEFLEEQPGQIVGHPLIRFIRPSERNAFQLTANSAGKAEFTIKRASGLETRAHFSFASIAASTDGSGILCCIVTDLTEQNRSSEALRIAHEQLLAEVKERERTEALLRQSQKMEVVGQLTGGVAHDFNNLLMAVSGGLDMLDRQTDPARIKRLKDGMRQAVERGAALTRQLLTFSRTKAIDAETVDVRNRIDGMRELLDRSLRGDITVRSNFEEHAWPVNIDVGEFELVILNLCVNARDAMPDGGTIMIAVRDIPSVDENSLKGDFVAVSVTDTGTGMSPETLGHAFEPFFTTKDVGKGSGLGLAQAYGFARSSGGAVTIDTRLGVGTTITLMLPRSEFVAEPALQSPLPSVEAAQGLPVGSCILLVEDDDEVAEFTFEMFAAMGFDVTRVASAVAALGALADGRTIDLVFSDVMMPGGMNGIHLASEIRQRRPDLPVILTSGRATLFTEDAARLKIEILPKPFGINALENMVRAALVAAPH
jgi:signal transduction histidine kinase/CheY-like chemotaxis protein